MKLRGKEVDCSSFFPKQLVICVIIYTAQQVFKNSLIFIWKEPFRGHPFISLSGPLNEIFMIAYCYKRHFNVFPFVYFLFFLRFEI